MRYPLHLEVRGVGGGVVFRSKSGLFNASRAEARRWLWLNEATVNPRWRTPNAWVSNPLSEVRSRLSEFEQACGDADDVRLEATFTRLFAPDQLLHSSSPEGGTVIEIAEQFGADAGAGALFAAMGHVRVAEASELERGVILYWVRRAAIVPSAASARVIRAAIEEANAASRDTSASSSYERHLARRALRMYLSAASRRIAEAVARASSDHQERIASIRSVEERYLLQMKIQAPVTYWNDRAEKHEKAARVFSIVGIVYAVITAIVVYYGGFVTLREEMLEIVKRTGQLQAAFVELSVFLLLATILFWVGRILSRLFLSERHLAADAAERAIMAETFMALSNDGSVSEAERPIVLAALFRSSSDGIVKEDGAPDPSLAAILARYLAPGPR